MLDVSTSYTNVVGAVPNVVGVNASGPSATDGFEFVANAVNDMWLGPMQMMLDHAGLAPNGVVESASASQIKEAFQKGFSCAPGVATEWNLALDPGTTGHRCLLRNGQGVLIASYTELDAACYVGDGNNAAVAAAGGGYYRASDAAGTTPDIAGPYLILPETRGYASRGLDTAASVDPDGASRYLGDVQADELKSHDHDIKHDAASATSGAFIAGSSVAGVLVETTELTGGAETRMSNFSTKFVVWY